MTAAPGGRAAMALILALAAPAAATAEDWTAYSYPNPGFAVQFPGPPDIEQDTYRTQAGAALPMTRYVAREDGAVFSVEVTDFSGAPADSLATIAKAERRLGASGKVTVAVDARINREFGRELSVAGDDGSRQVAAIFFVSGQLVELVAKALPPNPLARSADAIQFQQSLQFVGPNEALGGLDHYSDAGAAQGRRRSSIRTRHRWSSASECRDRQSAREDAIQARSLV